MRIPLLLVAFAVAAIAQILPPGTVLHAYGGPTVGVLYPGAQTAFPVTVLPASLGVRAMIADPTDPTRLFVAAADQRIYSVALGGGSPVPTPLTTQNLAGIKALAFDQSGDVIAVGANFSGEIFRIDRTTGAISVVVDYAASGNVVGGGQDPISGDWWAADGNGIHRFTNLQPGGVATQTTVHTASGSITSMAFDLLHPEWIAFLEAGDLKRLNEATGQVEVFEAGFPFFSDVVADDHGEFVVTRGRDVHRAQNPTFMPPGGVPVPLQGSNQTVGCCNNTGVAVVGAIGDPFALEVVAIPPGGAALAVTNAPPVALSSWLFVSDATSFPRGVGPLFGLSPSPLTLAVMQASTTPVVGSPIHAPGTPNPLLLVPAGSLSGFAGVTWDLVLVVFDLQGQASSSNVARVTWL